jgi:hypothetical protein
VRLVFGFAFADKLTYWGEHGLFGDEIVFATTTPYQRLVITKLEGRYAPVHQRQPAILLARRVPLSRSAGASGAAADAVGEARAGAGRRRRPGCAKSCVIRISSTSRWWTSTRP